MSRHKALELFQGKAVSADLEKQGIIARATSSAGLAEEAPKAYKDIEAVIDSVHDAGVSEKVARLVPLGVIKG
jgi:tRNA-splicing ligase RtcB